MMRTGICYAIYEHLLQRPFMVSSLLHFFVRFYYRQAMESCNSVAAVRSVSI